MPSFRDLPLIEPLQKAIAESGYTEPTPIQVAAIPSLLLGRDLLGCAQTGTGKTAAFALPLLQRLHEIPVRLRPRHPRVLVLTPTRELAIQIEESFRVYGKHLRLRTAVIFGGVGQNPQVKSLAAGVDVLVATPGRLLDLIDQGYLKLDGLEVFVLDEADRMLDMGFIHAIRKILPLLPKERQNLFFSATMPPEIQRLSQGILRDPVRVEVAPVSSTAEMISQSVLYVDKERKRDLLKHVLQDPKLKRVIVFTRTKHGANRVSEALEKNGVSSAAIHGNKSQGARQRALEDFRAGRVRVLVATDIAARGIDVDGITHVINYEIPNVSEDYVHRIGRTGRAGASGLAFTFVDRDDGRLTGEIEKLLKKKLEVEPYELRDERPRRSLPPRARETDFSDERPAAPRRSSAPPPPPRRAPASDPFFDRPYEPPAEDQATAAWDRAPAPAAAGNSLSRFIKPRRRIAALLGGPKG